VPCCHAETRLPIAICDSGNTPRGRAQGIIGGGSQAAEELALADGLPWPSRATPRLPSPGGARGREGSGGNAPSGRLRGDKPDRRRRRDHSFTPFAGLVPPLDMGTGPSENACAAASEPRSDPAGTAGGLPSAGRAGRGSRPAPGGGRGPQVVRRADHSAAEPGSSRSPRGGRGALDRLRWRPPCGLWKSFRVRRNRRVPN
jgi:hypothetical protein